MATLYCSQGQCYEHEKALALGALDREALERDALERDRLRDRSQHSQMGKFMYGSMTAIRLTLGIHHGTVFVSVHY